MSTSRRRRDAMRAVFGPEGGGDAGWEPDDLRAILAHQWQASLAREGQALLRHGGRSQADAAAALEQHGKLTIGQLLSSPRPPVALLDLVKRHAKASMGDGEELPRDVAHVLYVLAILRARAAGLPPITRLDAATVRRQAHRCLALGWLPPEVRDLIWASLPPGSG